MTERVVDLLEMVEIQHKQGARLTVPSDGRNVPIEGGLEAAAVWQSCHRIVLGEVVEL